jgi:hypothetical protein
VLGEHARVGQRVDQLLARRRLRERLDQVAAGLVAEDFGRDVGIHAAAFGRSVSPSGSLHVRIAFLHGFALELPRRRAFLERRAVGVGAVLEEGERPVFWAARSLLGHRLEDRRPPFLPLGPTLRA